MYIYALCPLSTLSSSLHSRSLDLIYEDVLRNKTVRDFFVVSLKFTTVFTKKLFRNLNCYLNFSSTPCLARLCSILNSSYSPGTDVVSLFSIHIFFLLVNNLQVCFCLSIYCLCEQWWYHMFIYYNNWLEDISAFSSEIIYLIFTNFSILYLLVTFPKMPVILCWN